MKHPLFYLRLTFVVSVVLLLLLSVIAYNRIRQSISYSDEVVHTYQVLLNVNELLSLAKDAETGQRGYLLTHERMYLQPYQEALLRIDRVQDSLRTLIHDNPDQQIRLDTLKKMLRRRLTVLDMALLYDSSRNGSLRERNEALQKGKQIMDSTRRLCARIQAREEILLSQRSLSRSNTERLAPTYLFGLAALALLLLCGSFLFLNRELRQRLAAQKELEQKIEALNHSNAELEQFAYVASHDLQEPLRKVRAFGSKLLVKHQAALNDEGRSLLEKIENSTARMQALIDDLLAFSRLVRPPGVQTLTNLNEVLREVTADLSESIRAKKAEVRIAQLPTLEAYPSQMRQLFQNLLSNALKFTRTDLTLRISITYDEVKGSDIAQATGRWRDEPYHRITIRDNGIGFEQQYAEKIFVIFQRLHTRAEYEGTGIGLAMCKRVVTNHQGFIEAGSSPGEGATFAVYLPVNPTSSVTP